MNKLIKSLLGVSLTLAMALDAASEADTRQVSFWPGPLQAVHGSLDTFTGHCPEWMKGIDLSSTVMQDTKPAWKVSVLDIIRTDGVSDAWAWQGSWSSQNDEKFYNIGLIYRAMYSSYLVGFNAFWDHSVRLGHDRLTVGAELIGHYFTLSGNCYNAISELESDGVRDGIAFHEKAVDGYDISLSAPLPYMPWARIEGLRECWKANREGLKNRKVNAIAFLARLTPRVHIEVGVRDGNYDESFSYGTVTMNLGSMVSGIETSLLQTRSNAASFTPRDLSQQFKTKVRRQNFVVAETSAYEQGSGDFIDGYISIGE